MGFNYNAISYLLFASNLLCFELLPKQRIYMLSYCTVQMFNIRYPEMHKVQSAKCAIRKLMYGLSVCTDDNHSLQLMAYRLVHTDEPYITSNLHLSL